MYQDAPHSAARRLGFRSGLEVLNAKILKALGVAFDYEKHVIRYTMPASAHKYTPDFVLPNGIVVETKGRWITADRKKLRLIREQHPGIDIRMVFSNSKARISKASKTTYRMVCEKLGLPWADKEIPKSWLTEPTNHQSLAALEAASHAPHE